MSNQSAIVRYAIHPGIGIARVGNSPDEYFIGPEAPGEVPDPDGGYKDSAGRIKRQAARFRIYGASTKQAKRYAKSRWMMRRSHGAYTSRIARPAGTSFRTQWTSANMP